MNSGAKKIIGLVVGLVQAGLLIRLILKLLGANSENVFVNGVYMITQPVVAIFEGIFAQISVTNISAAGVFEPATLIAMLVVALIGWVLQKFFSGH
ncbi:YggT family protein [Acetobacterium paludosum]|uniref:YggT family protein n=1 Tax=Acetobacterium paludosum TaxID=52693 RepID=A0A923HVC8_9FIRM|nr:YggT family protein [Acetobacterium paludosum]MBC3887935.1 YggT family protein [Acetobacterium paludosum]